jgi:sec-independent protein translocase protein TatC
MTEKEMTFIEHIIELRNRLKVVAISFVAALIFWMAFPRDFLSIVVQYLILAMRGG